MSRVLGKAGVRIPQIDKHKRHKIGDSTSVFLQQSEDMAGRSRKGSREECLRFLFTWEREEGEVSDGLDRV